MTPGRRRRRWSTLRMWRRELQRHRHISHLHRQPPVRSGGVCGHPRVIVRDFNVIARCLLLFCYKIDISNLLTPDVYIGRPLYNTRDIVKW